jgi:capsular exopolysaccharide synthesis family protein
MMRDDGDDNLQPQPDAAPAASAASGRSAVTPGGAAWTVPPGGPRVATAVKSSVVEPAAEPRRAGTGGAAGARPSAESASELSRYVGVLLDRRWVLIGILVLLQIAAVLWTSAQPRIYETRSSILVEASVPQVLGSAVQDSIDPSPANFYMVQDFLQTSRKVLTSDTLARGAAARLHLLGEPSFFAPAPVPTTLEDAAEVLLSHYTADVVAETRLLLVTARHTDPAWAKKIADAVADEFVADAEQNRETTTQRTSQQLADELDLLRKSLHEAEVALYEFKSKHDMLSVNLEDRANQVARQIDKYTDALTEVRLRKLQRQSQLEELKKLKEVDPLHIPVLSGSTEMPSLLGDLRRSYAEEQRRLAELRARYQDSHPQVQQQSSKVEQLLRELGREVEVALGAATLRYNETLSDEQKVLGQVEALKQEGLRISRLEIEYNKLKRDADSLQKQYNMVLNRTKETGMVGRLRLRSLRVLDYARLPRVAVSPRLRVAIGLALVVGLLLGVSAAFALDALDRTLKSHDDIETYLGLPLLGMLPRFVPDSRGRHPPDLYVAYHSRSTVAEACRAIRTNLMFAATERPLHTILLTSSMAREGKTLSCVSLGTVLAKAGERTLIIDCDLRRPRIARALGVTSSIGLTSVLVGEASLAEAVRETPVEHLYVLPSGPLPPNPAELLGGSHFRTLLAELAARYDRVLIDSPPAVPVTDPAILSTSVDGVVLVVRHAATHRDAARRAAQHILDVGGNIIGVVLNEIDTAAKGYRSYYGLYSDYKSDYHAESTEDAPARPD